MSHLPTSTDFIHSIFYATDVIKKIKCTEDKEILKRFPDGAFTWQDLDQFRTYPCPDNLQSPCQHGKCRIANKETCNLLSQLPFNDDGSALNQPSCTPATGATGGSSNDDSQCQNLGYEAICGSDGKCTPKHPYLEWSLSYTGPDGGPGRCIVGNSSLRKWCEFPETRRTESTPGVTNVPAFQYLDEESKCQITKDYCDWMQVSYRATGPDGPDCYTTGIQQFFEDFLVGRTIFRGLKSLFEGFDKLDYQLEKIAERRYASEYEVIQKDFGGPGIHLYSIIWKDNAIKADPKLNGSMAGFFADEVEKVYPDLVKKKKGDKCIIINRTQVKLDPRLKRIYLVVGAGKWILESMLKAAEKDLRNLA